MKSVDSRRSFLQKSAIATTGITLFSTGIIHALINQNPYQGYNPYAEERTDLRTTFFDKHVRVKGVVYDASGSGPLSDATVEVWHLSPNSTKYRHRGKLTTNQAGEYNFITDFPNKIESSTARIYFKINYKGASYFTELAVGDKIANITSRHWEENQHLGEKLFPTSERFLNTTTINFNLSIN